MGDVVRQYHELLEHVLRNGVRKSDRTGTGTLSVFGYQMRFDLQQGFPLLTTKKLHWFSIVDELLWFLSGSTNINDLQCKIWNEWADPDTGELGPVYGKQWRYWEGPNGPIDQIRSVVNEIRSNPDSRRLIVSAWNVSDLPLMKLPPCHCLFQFYVADGRLSCQLYQRSGDIFLGVPFNIASYSLLTSMVAQVTDLAPGEFIHTLGDAHLYSNHVEQAHLQLSRSPLPLPTLRLNRAIRELDHFSQRDIELIGYQSHPFIKAPIAV